MKKIFLFAIIAACLTSCATTRQKVYYTTTGCPYVVEKGQCILINNPANPIIVDSFGEFNARHLK